MSQSVPVGVAWGATAANFATSNIATVVTVSSGSWKDADLGAKKEKPVEKKDDGEGETKPEEKAFSNLLYSVIFALLF